MQELLLTVITPTYNRAHKLTECYQSLRDQTDNRFVWMVVDDGSTDDTESLVENLIEENQLRIEYLKKNNGGKASALNFAINHLNTAYACCLDSDDTFYPNAVAKALEQLTQTEEDEKCCGILALRSNRDGTVMGGREIPRFAKRVSAADIFLRFNLKTELICFYKTRVLRNYRFPTFEGEKFVSPAWMQYAITQDYYYQPCWAQLCRCEYEPDGLTRNKAKVIQNNPKGYCSVKRWSFDLAPSLGLRIRHGIMYDYGCIIANDKNWLNNVKHKWLAIILWPVAYIACLRKNHK